MDLDKAIQNRHSVRKFLTTKKPDWRTILECLDAARFAPMAGNNYSMKFILVGDKTSIEKLAQACQQPFVGEAHYIVVAVSVRQRTTNAYGEIGEVFLRQQAGAAIENFLLKLQGSGLATCWIGYFVEEEIKNILQIPANAQVEALFPIGYAAEKKHTVRRKIDLESIVFFEKFGNKRMQKIKKLEG